MNRLFFAAIFFAFSFVAIAQPLSKKDLDKARIFGDPNDKKRVLKDHINDDNQWVCFPYQSGAVRLRCEDLGLNEIEGAMEELKISVTDGSFHHEYGLRRGIHRSECRRMKRKVFALLKNVKEACVRGSLIPLQDPKPTNIAWVFDEFKSTNGSACEFVGCE